jgi:hypothetical protein
MPFELFLVQHSHIDVGYTERQERIADYQAQFIAQAVKYAHSEKQSRRAADSRFKFTCEGFWAIEQYLRKYGPNSQAPLVEAIRSGYLELSAFYLHLAELLDEGHLRDSIQYAVDFSRQNNLQLTVAMANDINGFSWGLADVLSDAGIKYLITNLNTHHGGPPLGKPMQPFYWESPAGKKLLVWSGLPYHKANLLGLIPGYNPTSDPGIPGMVVNDETGFMDVQDISLAEKRVYQLVETLKAQAYPYNFLPIMGGGLYTDNGPVTDDYCELVSQWNLAHGNEIHIQTASLDEFFQHLQQHGGEIPTYRGDWNDWWTDGTISTPYEVKMFRNAQRTKRVVEMLDPQAQIVSRQQLAEITNKLVVYAEHTWGHSASHPSPWKFLVQQLDARKDKLAIDADVLASEALDTVLRAYGEGEFTCRRPFEYRIINPLDVAKKYVAFLPVDFWEVDVFKNGYQVKDSLERTYKCQHTHTLRGWMIAVELELAPKEIRELKLEPANREKTTCPELASCFENPWYRLEWNIEGITALISSESGTNLLSEQQTQPGEPVYQVFPNGNRSDSAGFGYSARKKPANVITSGSLQSLKMVEHGEVFTTLKAVYSVPGASVYQVYFTLYTGLPQIAISVEMTKDIVTDPEGMYTAFPFAISGGQWHIDKPGALILPGRDQLPGTCCDYYPVNHGAVLVGNTEGVALTCLDAPMVTIGALKLWDFTTTIEPVGTLYSWLCNNKWETNFKADCGGFYEFRYIVEFAGNFKNPQQAQKAVQNNSYDALVTRK